MIKTKPIRSRIRSWSTSAHDCTLFRIGKFPSSRVLNVLTCNLWNLNDMKMHTEIQTGDVAKNRRRGKEPYY
jgi:hypothetical protein